MRFHLLNRPGAFLRFEGREGDFCPLAVVVVLLLLVVPAGD
jgi:hypothetical protein